MIKAVGYVRVSTISQVDDGVSLAAQEVKIRAWADLNGYEEVVVYSDPELAVRKWKRVGVFRTLWR